MGDKSSFAYKYPLPSFPTLVSHVNSGNLNLNTQCKFVSVTNAIFLIAIPYPPLTIPSLNISMNSPFIYNTLILHGLIILVFTTYMRLDLSSSYSISVVHQLFLSYRQIYQVVGGRVSLEFG